MRNNLLIILVLFIVFGIVFGAKDEVNKSNYQKIIEEWESKS